MVREILASEAVGPVGKFKYSSPAYVVAGAMAEKLTGKSWERLMEELSMATENCTLLAIENCTLSRRTSARM